MKQRRGKLFAGLFVGAAVAAMLAYIFWARSTLPPEDKYRTATVDRGDIIQSVSASGTLKPVVVVNVGTQISGTILRLHADFNDQVRKGDVLAELDPALLNAQLAQNQASLKNAEIALRFAGDNLRRQQGLHQKGFISDAALDEARQAVDSARAQVEQARAQVRRDATNLGYSVIRSPISGVVVARDVDLGQTVAASFQTPTLFQIAQDLQRMQIDTSVAEADVGLVRTGQLAQFTVDAFPGREFTGRVRQIRLNPAVQQNVVTYNVVVEVDNTDGHLLPGMTAHVQISVDQRTGVLRVPTAALRFRPKDDEGKKKPRGATVYRLNAINEPEPVSVKTGITDNTLTEITSGALREGDVVITRELGPKQGDKEKGNFKLRTF